MRHIHKANNYLLEGRILDSRTGRTVELYQTFPDAEHPRAQRILQLNLPPQAYFRLAKIFEETML